MNSQEIEIKSLEQPKTGNIDKKLTSVEVDFLSKGKKNVNDTVTEIQKNFKREKDMGDSL